MKLLFRVLTIMLALTCCHAQNRRGQNNHNHININNIPYNEKHEIRDHRETTTWIPILKYNKEQSEDGSYKTEYETGNNIVHEESGFLKDFHIYPHGALVQHGQYSYKSPEGEIVNVQYIADEMGFRATGDHIPTPPAIPFEIQKGLDQIYAGIKLQQERMEERAKTDPEFAKRLEERRVANQKGHYVGMLEK